MENANSQPLLSDLYQINMAYTYWKNGRSTEEGTFDIFFKNLRPYGEFAVFAGLADCLRFLENFTYSDSDVAFLRILMDDSVDPGFFDYLSDLVLDEIKVHAVPEGTVVFPRVPVLRIEGPLPIVQLIKTNLLRIVSNASVIATNAARYRIAAGPSVQLYELGQRRGLGADGALSASKYAYVGGFHGTSNSLVGKLYGIPLISSQGRSFITSCTSRADCKNIMLKRLHNEEMVNFLDLCLKWRQELSKVLNVLEDEGNDGELVSFVCLAVALPKDFLALIDSYEINGGLLNFCSVALALNELGYRAAGVQISRGDLSWSSTVARETFKKVSKTYDLEFLAKFKIFARTDMNEDALLSLGKQNHAIDCFGIDNHILTCPKHTGVKWFCELVQVDSKPCGKGCTDVDDATIPGKKSVFRLYGKNGLAVIDLLQSESERTPEESERVLCRHPFEESKRAYVQPTKVVHLLQLYWNGGKPCKELRPLTEVRKNVEDNLDTLDSSIKRNFNPTPYKVSVSEELYKFMHKLMLENAPIRELK